MLVVTSHRFVTETSINGQSPIFGYTIHGVIFPTCQLVSEVCPNWVPFYQHAPATPCCILPLFFRPNSTTPAQPASGELSGCDQISSKKSRGIRVVRIGFNFHDHESQLPLYHSPPPPFRRRLKQGVEHPLL